MKREVNKIGKRSQWVDSIYKKVIRYSNDKCCFKYLNIHFNSYCVREFIYADTNLLFKNEFSNETALCEEEELVLAACCELCMCFYILTTISALCHCHFCYPDPILMYSLPTVSN